jgi:hypothetical protein
MINPSEEVFIREYAYVPEHMPGYVTAISGKEPFLLEGYLCYYGQDTLLFVGYPLKESFHENKMDSMLETAVRRFKPAQVVLMAPAISRRVEQRGAPDTYYILDLPNVPIRSKVKNMIHRASRELRVEKTHEFKNEHLNLIADFLRSRSVEEGTRSILGKIPEYISSVPTAWIFSVRDRTGRLAAFDTAEFGAKNYAFYMFNFRSPKDCVPGASDLLLYTLIHEAQEQGKPYINLGLGINAGVAFFKRKWGGRSFLRHEFVSYRLEQRSLLDALAKGLIRP